MAESFDIASLSPTSLERYIEQSANDYVDEVINRAVRNLQQNVLCRSCQQFTAVVDGECRQCDNLIDKLVSETMYKLQQQFCSDCSQPLKKVAEPVYEFNDDYKTEESDFGTIAEFNVLLGTEMIEKYIQTWEYDKRWLYCIDFLRKEDFKFDTRYRYQVRWSIPTRGKPIPRATASIFFTFLLSTIKPKNYPVEVYFILETNRLVHRPNKTRFREEWLQDIIESKILLINSVNF